MVMNGTKTNLNDMKREIGNSCIALGKGMLSKTAGEVDTEYIECCLELVKVGNAMVESANECKRTVEDLTLIRGESDDR